MCVVVAAVVVLVAAEITCLPPRSMAFFPSSSSHLPHASPPPQPHSPAAAARRSRCFRVRQRPVQQQTLQQQQQHVASPRKRNRLTRQQHTDKHNKHTLNNKSADNFIPAHAHGQGDMKTEKPTSAGNFLSAAFDKFAPRRLHGGVRSNSRYKGTTKAIISDVTTMGKSNKFDYTNRPNSGAKLGQIIGTALQKEAEKVRKDAERHHEKARKLSAGSADGAAPVDATKHVIDLKAPSKDLGDEGVGALADGLEAALRSGTPDAALALEDLNLSGNGLTTLSLARLAPIIQLALCDIKTINLSGNCIQVDSDEQAERWETFLRSFACCFRLRRLDLSGNTQLAARAFEILARVHIMEYPISPVQLGGESSVHSLLSDDETLMPTLPSFESIAAREAYHESLMTQGQLMKRRCGLRSIPYLTVHDIGLDDASALWLSFVLQDHYYPNQLMDELNAANAESLIKAYQQDTKSTGIDWTDNKAAGKEGLHLLEKTETIRRQILLDNKTVMSSSTHSDEHFGTLEASEASRRKSVDRRASRAKGDRRASLRSIHTEDGGEHEASELESARRKIQRHIIAQHGVTSVELWNAAIKVIRASRLVVYISPVTNKYSPQTESPADRADSVREVSRVAPARGQADEIFVSPGNTAFRQGPSYNTKVAGIFPSNIVVPEVAITERTNTPTFLPNPQKAHLRKDAFSEGVDSAGLSDRLTALTLPTLSKSKKYLDYQTSRIAHVAQSGRSFRDTSVPCRVPAQLLERIVEMAVGKSVIRVLGEWQKRDAICWGQRRETLGTEREWLKKDDSAQIWMLLDGVGCLGYGEGS